MKAGIRVHGIEMADNIWFTCCALHNMLLNIDGLHKKWRKGVKSPFQGELGWHAVGDVETYAPLIFRRINNAGSMRELDTSSMARGNDLCPANVDDYDEEKKEIKPKMLPEKNYKIIKLKKKIFETD